MKYEWIDHEAHERDFASQLRSDTLMSHQSDPRHRSSLIPTRDRNDDINLENLAARTSLGRCDRGCFGTERIAARWASALLRQGRNYQAKIGDRDVKETINLP